MFTPCGLAVLFKQINSIGNQECLVQDMAAKFPSSKQLFPQIFQIRTQGVNNFLPDSLSIQVSHPCIISKYPEKPVFIHELTNECL